MRACAGQGSAVNALLAVIYGLILGVAIAVLVVVYQLYYVTWYYSGYRYYTYYDSACLLTYNGINTCAYMFVVCGVTFFLGIFGLGLQFATVRAKAQAMANAKYEVLMAVFGVCWWVAAAVTTTVYTQRVNDSKPEVPQAGDRAATWIMSWVQVGLFVAASLLSMVHCVRASKRQDSFVAAPQGAGPDYGAGGYPGYPPPPPAYGAPVPGYPAPPSQPDAFYSNQAYAQPQGYPPYGQAPPPAGYPAPPPTYYPAPPGNASGAAKI